MLSKPKICNGCKQLKYIWKNYAGDKFCQACWNKHSDCVKPAKPTVRLNKISQRSSKKVKDDREYSLLRRDFLTKNPFCQANLLGCIVEATDIHHTFWGADRSKYYLDSNTWKSVCRVCHSYIHDKMSSEDAIKKGLKNYKHEE